MKLPPNRAVALEYLIQLQNSTNRGVAGGSGTSKRQEGCAAV